MHNTVVSTVADALTINWLNKVNFLEMKVLNSIQTLENASTFPLLHSMRSTVINWQLLLLICLKLKKSVEPATVATWWTFAVLAADIVGGVVNESCSCRPAVFTKCSCIGMQAIYDIRRDSRIQSYPFPVNGRNELNCLLL